MLNAIQNIPGSRTRKKRLGRGIGSGKGKTCGAGGKGQTARSGVSIKGFEGGQTPLHRRLPKRGFTNIFRKKYAEINLCTLEDLFNKKSLKADQRVTLDLLKKLCVIKGAVDGVRLLAKGAISHPVNIDVCGASRTASLAVEKAGGRVHLLKKA